MSHVVSRTLEPPADNPPTAGAAQTTPTSAHTEAAALDPFERFHKTRVFSCLDGLRAIAILLVIWQHAPAIRHGAEPLTNAGATGVALFFALSGFLITTLLLREEQRHGRVSLRDFYIRRSLRIFPLYYAMLGLYAVLIAIREHNAAGRLFFENLPYYATYTSNWFVDLKVNEDGQRRVIFVFAWSLATEEQFYLFWPACLAFLRRRWAILALLSVMVIDVCSTFYWGELDEPASAVERTFRIIQSPSTEIGLGVLGALLLHSRAGFAAAWRVLGSKWSAPVAAGLVALAACWAPQPSPTWYLIQSFTLAGLVLACVIREDNGLAVCLRLRPLARLGVVSYGIYLMHGLAIDVAELGMRKIGLSPSGGSWSAVWHPARFVLTLVIVWLSAEVSFRIFESWFLRLKDRFKRA